MKELTQSELKEVVHYDPLTGVFTWVVRRSWNSRAGDRAGSIDGTGYWQLSAGGRNYRAHRLAWLWMTGEWPSNEVDHIDGNRSNNAWSNLRDVTHAQNCQNVGPRRTNRFGLKGVTLTRGRYMAQIKINGHNVYLGKFKTAEEAHAAYASAVKQHGGECARAS